MIVPCHYCRKKFDIIERDFDAVAKFAVIYNTIAKFICFTCTRKKNGKPGKTKVQRT